MLALRRRLRVNAAVRGTRRFFVGRRSIRSHGRLLVNEAQIAGCAIAHLLDQGLGLGGQLLLSAGRRCVLAAAEVGGVVLVIDAKNEQAAAWYSSYGALQLDDSPLTLMLPLSTIAAALDLP